MNHHQNYLAKKRFASLDGLRAISILAVIWHHAAPGWINHTIVQAGAFGVTLFFAISGFLITTLLLRERDKHGTIDLKAFYLRRVYRILPLYYGVLLLYIVVVTLFEKDPAAKQGFYDNLIYFATYTSNLFVPLDGRVIFFFAWSLAAEEQFYLVWPPLLYITRTVPKALILLLCVIAIFIIDALLGRNDFYFVSLAIVGGSLLAVVLHTKKGFDLTYLFLGRKLSVFIVIAILIACLFFFKVPGYVLHILFVLLVGACTIREDHPMRPLLTLKPIAYIGTISYGLYMLHMLCLNASIRLLDFLGWKRDGFEVLLLTVPLSILAAGISFRYYESYFLKLKKKHERS